jgi:hypothetical protein
MNYVIAIPTLSRPEILRKKTLNFLHQHGIARERIYIFLVAEEAASYRLHELPGYNTVIGKMGLVNQRNLIQDTFPVGQHIVMLDDDIDCLDMSVSDKFKDKTLHEFFLAAFKECVRVDATLWSIYPVWNQFFRQDQQEVTYCQNYMIGAFFGIINTDHRLVVTDVKEDVFRSIEYFLKDGVLVRYNRIGFKTKYYGVSGGMGTLQNRLEPSKDACATLQRRYPDHGSIKTRKNGITEFVLKKLPPVKEIAQDDQEIYVGEEIPPEELGLLYQMLSEMSISHKPAKSRHGFPKHRAQVFGYTLRRIVEKGGSRAAISRYTKLYPHIYQQLVEIGTKYAKIPFNSIYVNHNVTCPRHKDSNNVGKSCLISLGEYTGGNIVIEGVKYDANCRAIIFNGGKLEHWNTDDLVGNKYSLVFYQTKLDAEVEE